MLQSVISNGASTGFYSGNPRVIVEDLAELKPTVFPGVPKVYNRFYDIIQGKFREATGIKKSLIDRAIASKSESFDSSGSVTHMLYDRLIFNKIKAVLGGRVRVMASGAAPLNGEVARFLQICFAAPIRRMYGQTENTGPATVTAEGDWVVGHQGGPLPGFRMKVVSVPEMSYFSTDRDADGDPLARGELCISGNTVFRGYYKDPVKTREAVDEDGWLHTGDIASVDKTGRIRIIDRKKALFKLSQGEYVSPEKVENVYVTSKYVAQSWVYGDPLRDYTVGVVVPDEGIILKEAKEQFDIEGSFADVIKHELVKNLVLEDVKSIGKKAGLKGFEGIRKIYLDSELFTSENGLLTPTFKMKRNAAKERYSSQIKELYKN